MRGDPRRGEAQCRLALTRRPTVRTRHSLIGTNFFFFFCFALMPHATWRCAGHSKWTRRCCDILHAEHVAAAAGQTNGIKQII